MYVLVLILNYVACLAVSLAFWRRFICKDSNPHTLFLEAFTVGNLFYCAEAWAFAEGLSLANALKTPEPMVGLHLASIIACVYGIWIWKESAIESLRSFWSSSKDSLTIKLLALTVLLILLPLFFIALSYPPCTADSMSYHMPRLMHWIQNGNLEMYPTNYPRQLYYQPFPEFLILPWEQVLESDFVDNTIQCFALVVLLAQLALLVRFFGGNALCQLLAMGLALAAPIVIFEAPTTQTDIVVSSLFFAFVYFGLKLSRRNPDLTPMQLSAYAICLGASLGLSLNTKLSVATFEIPFCIWFGLRYLAIHYRSDQPINENKAVKIFGLMVIGFLLFNGPYFSRNAAISGSIFGPDEIQQKMRNLRFGIGPTFSNALRNITMQLRVPSDKVNVFNRDMVSSIHETLGMSIMDPTTTYCGDGTVPYEYETIFVLDDYRSGNSLIILLFLITGGATLIQYYRLGAPENVANSKSDLPANAGGKASKKRSSMEQTSRTEKGEDTGSGEISLGFFATLMILGFMIFSGLFRWQPFGARLLLPCFLGVIPFIAIKMNDLLPLTRTMLLTVMVFFVGVLYTVFIVATTLFFDPSFTLLAPPPQLSEFEAAMQRQEEIEQWKLQYPPIILSGKKLAIAKNQVVPTSASPDLATPSTTTPSTTTPSTATSSTATSSTATSSTTTPSTTTSSITVPSTLTPSTMEADAEQELIETTINQELFGDYFIPRENWWETMLHQRKYKYFRLIRMYMSEYLAISNKIKELESSNVGFALRRFYDRWEYPFWPLVRDGEKKIRFEWVIYPDYLTNSVNYDPTFVPDVIITDYSQAIIEHEYEIETAWTYEHLVLVKVKGRKPKTDGQQSIPKPM